MAKPAQKLWTLKGTNHQGEGTAGKAPRIHLIDNGGCLPCAAVPRSKRIAKHIYKREFLRGVFGPPCPDCKRMLKDKAFTPLVREPGKVG